VKITKSQLKQIIKEELQQVLSEKTLFSTLIDLLGKDHSARYKGKKGKETADFERLLKQMWNAEVDRSFIESVKLVHWLMSGDPTQFLTTSSKDEISTEGYLPDEPMVSNFAKGTQIGVLIDGYVTFAMRSGGGTGFFGGRGLPEKWKSSGMVKRAPAKKANFRQKLIFNSESQFRSTGMYNEFIVDNWAPTALVAVGGLDNPFYKELYAYSKESGLPIVNENGEKVELKDPASFSMGKKFTTGASRLMRGALPEGKQNENF
jgi:uncharacterized protein (UPF0297 family)